MTNKDFAGWVSKVFLFFVLINQCASNELQDQVMVEYLVNNEFLHGKAEIVFLLDRSGSVGSANFEIEKGFVESFLTHIVVDVNASRVAVISYSNTAVLHIDYLREPRTKCFLSQALQDVVFIDSRATNIAAALDKAQLVFQNARPNVNKVVVLISDGLATIGGDPVPHADRLKATGVEIFCFGVGKVLQNELLLLASSEQHVYSCSQYKDFQRLARKIRGDPHETAWSGQATTPNCDHMCDSPYKDDPNDPGCCDHYAKCSCALLSGMHTCVCGPGYYGLSGLAGHCRACPKGSYKSRLEPSRKCTPCPEGSTTEREASTGIKDCICKKGYEGDPSKGVNCTLVKCPPLQSPTRGYLLGHCDVRYGSECLFTCEDGYELVDKSDDIRTCQSNGTWSGKTSRCQRIQCNAPSNPSFGIRKCDDTNFYVGSKCRFFCFRGFIMEGSKERECLTNKRWSGTEVKCIPVECELPPPLKYGHVINCKKDTKPTFLKTCVFKCNGGFELEGPAFLTCAEDGKLKDEGKDVRKPYCKDVKPPEITCPAARLIKAENGKDGATVNWEIPYPIDNSGIEPKLYPYPAITPPAYLPIGSTFIQYVAIDHVGFKSHCDFHIAVYDDEPPIVLRCPSKIEISSDDVLERAFWEEPHFQDNSRRDVRTRKSHSPGDLFSPGRHTVTYQAFDESNNKAECIFDVIMTRNTCPYYPAPVNGAFSCDDLMFGQICQVFCNDRYDFVEQPAEWYVCNGESKWVTEPDHMPIPWPDCSRPAPPDMVLHRMKGFYYQGDCNDPQVQVQIKKMFLGHLLQKADGCFRQGTCKLNNVRVRCGKTTDHLRKRVRRDVWEHAFREDLELEFEITINMDQELNDTEAVLQNFLETIQNLKWDTDEDIQQTTTLSPNGPITQLYHPTYTNRNASTPGTVVITEENTEMICKPGSVLNLDLCVLCAPGTFYDSSMQECLDCPLGHYQEEEGQFHCEKCPNGMSTEYRRSRNETDCKGICLPGTYSKSGLETCMACPIGTYQEHVGQHICEFCPGRTTTTAVQSASLSECKEMCEPGSFSESGLQPCELCPIGHYQPSSGQKACIECPTNFSTVVTGSMNVSQCLDLDPCSDEFLCWNGGQCGRVGRMATCACKEGFKGDRCERDVDECDQEPCYNGGYCINVEGSFYCNCSDGLTGPLCEVEVNECSSSPCLNNGTCLDKVNDYACVCPAGFEGRSCEIAQEICSHDIICLNGGQCLQGSNGTTVCSCRPGYTGVDCSLDIDECQEATCYNNASCVDSIASYKCVCAPGYTGDACQTDVDDCEFNQCWSGSTCKDLIETYECLCPPGWGGTWCETKMDDNFILNFPESTATIANMATMKLNSPLSDVTVSMWVQTTDTEHTGTPMSYAVASATTTNGEETVVDNALTISDCSGIHIYVNNEPLVTDVQVTDGQWHHLAFSWSSQNSGEWTLYKDGKLQTNGTHLRPQDVVSGGGTMVIGQEQDTVGGGFSPVETFTGNITRVNVWNSYFSQSNITRLCQLDDDIPGKVVAWPDFLRGIKGSVNILQNERPALEGIL